MKSKAIFLLVIFLLNTVVGFGCALGMEGDHHDKTRAHTNSANHVHKDHDHHHADGHQHKAARISGQNFSKEDLCCKTLVNDLVTQSKLTPDNGRVQIILPVLWLPDYAPALSFPVTSIGPDQRVYADRRERPPNQNIRIVIQSFQI